MKKLTIIPCDQAVLIDGQLENFSFSMDANIHAIQWDGVKEKGWIEYKDDTDNKPIDLSYIQSIQDIIAGHGTTKTERLAKEARDKADREAANPPPTPEKLARRKELTEDFQLQGIVSWIKQNPGNMTPDMQAVIDKSDDLGRRFPKA